MTMHSRQASALDLFTDSIRIMGDATQYAVMEFDRRLDPQTLEKAAHACIRAHPILHSRLVRGSGPAFWEMIDPVRIPQIGAELCEEDYHSRVISPVDPYGPLQASFRLLRRPSGDVIVIGLAHAAADAYGLHTLMNQLLQEYQNPGCIPPASGGIPDRDTHWTRALDHGGNPATSDLRTTDQFWPDLFGISDAPSAYHRVWVSPPELTAVRERVKTFQGNVNDVVMASYFLTLSDLTGRYETVTVFFPVNLRQHLRDGSRVMSNQSTNVCFPIRRSRGEGMDAILPRVIEQTHALKAASIGIAEQAGMDASCDPEGRHIQKMAEQMAAQVKNGRADIFISNPGPIMLPEVPGLADAYICYPGARMPVTCFVISTFRGRMTITMGYQNSRKAREGTKKAVDLFREYFLSVADIDIQESAGLSPAIDTRRPRDPR